MDSVSQPHNKCQLFTHYVFSWDTPCSLLAPCKGIRIPESGKFLLLELGILGFEIRNLT